MTSEFAPAGPGGQMVPVPVRCRHRFQSAPRGESVAACSCGLYSIGECSTCQAPFCGDHVRTVNGRRICSTCVASARRDALAAEEREVARIAEVLKHSASARELTTAILEAGDGRVQLSTSEALRIWKILGEQVEREPLFEFFELAGGATVATVREVAPAEPAHCWRIGAGLRGITTGGKSFEADTADRIADPPFVGSFVTSRGEGVRSRFGSGGRELAAVQVTLRAPLSLSLLREFLDADGPGPERVFADLPVEREMERLASLASAEAKRARDQALAIGLVGLIVLGLPLWIFAADSLLVLAPWAWLILWVVVPRVIPRSSQERRQLATLQGDPSRWPAEPPTHR